MCGKWGGRECFGNLLQEVDEAELSVEEVGVGESVGEMWVMSHAAQRLVTVCECPALTLF